MKEKIDDMIIILDDLNQTIQKTTDVMDNFNNTYNGCDINLQNEFICNKSRSQCNHCGKCSTKSRKWVGINKGRKKKRRK